MALPGNKETFSSVSEWLINFAKVFRNHINVVVKDIFFNEHRLGYIFIMSSIYLNAAFMRALVKQFNILRINDFHLSMDRKKL